MELFLNDKLGKISLEISEANKSKAILIIAHGAGAGMHHSFMQALSDETTALGMTAVRFNFPYMEQGRKSPGSPKSNIETWKLVISHIHKKHPKLPIFISGKSYGGRMGSHILAENHELPVRGIIYFGFPLHAPGRDSKDRATHLNEVKVPQLFLQGAKDKLANLDLMNEVVNDLSNAKMKVIEDGDHSFNVPKRSGKTKDKVIKFLADEATTWISQI